MPPDSSTVHEDAPLFSIVIPIYNEEAILRTSVVDLVDRLSPWNGQYEILLAENGSSDATVKIANELSDRFAAVSCFSVNEPNYGLALREGILRARGTYVLCDEIDLCDVDFHRRALELLQTRTVDLVVGSKLMGGSSDERPLVRHLGSMTINALLRVGLGFQGTDTHGLKAFRREALTPYAERCIVDKDLFASEFVIRAQRGGVAHREIPVRVLEKRAPSIGLFKRVPRVLRDLGKLFVAIRLKGGGNG